MFEFYKKFILTIFLLSFLFQSLLSQATSEISPEETVEKQTPTEVVPSDNGTSSTNFYQDPTKNRQDTTSFFGLMFRTLMILVVFAIVAWLILKYIKSRQQADVPEDGPIQVLYDFPLTMNKKLQVIKIVNQYLLLGISGDQIHHLCELTDKETIDQFNLERGKKINSNSFFQDILGNYIKFTRHKPLDNTKALLSRLKRKKE